ncbi:MAG: hypothetical protein U0894_07685 [Pirellulales bacterium]
MAPLVWGADTDTYTHREDVIYGRKFGTALTMDVFTPMKMQWALRLFAGAVAGIPITTTFSPMLRFAPFAN